MSFYVLIRFFFFKAMCNNIDVVYRNYNSLVTLILLKWFYISAVYIIVGVVNRLAVLTVAISRHRSWIRKCNICLQVYNKV